MFFGTGQYPELKGMSSSEQRALLKAALKAHDPAQWWRFLVAILLAIVVGYGLDHAILLSGFQAEPLEYAGSFFTGLSFYGYLLWEINTRTRVAVIRYLSERTDT